MGLFTEFIKKIIVDEMKKEGFNVEPEPTSEEVETDDINENVETEQTIEDVETKPDNDNLIDFEKIFADKVANAGQDNITKTLGRAIYEAQAQALKLKESEESTPDKAFARVMGLIGGNN